MAHALNILAIDPAPSQNGAISVLRYLTSLRPPEKKKVFHVRVQKLIETNSRRKQVNPPVHLSINVVCAV